MEPGQRLERCGAHERDDALALGSGRDGALERAQPGVEVVGPVAGAAHQARARRRRAGSAPSRAALAWAPRTRDSAEASGMRRRRASWKRSLVQASRAASARARTSGRSVSAASLVEQHGLL